MAQDDASITSVQESPLQRIGRSVLCGVASLSCARAVTEPTPSAPERVYATFDRIATDSLWPGFHPRMTAVAIYDGDQTWLFGHPAPPPEFTSHDQAPGVATYDGRHPAVTANTSTVLAGEPTAAIFLQIDVNPDPISWAGIAVHEAFHVFQESHHRDWRPNEMVLFTYPRDDVQALTLRRLETGAMRAALAASAHHASACWTRHALGYRARRFSVIDSASATYELESERLEGLADYVELRATGAVLTLPKTGYRPDEIRPRTYAIGTAMGLLLDRFDPSWREQIEDGDSRYLDAILSSVVSAEVCDFVASVNLDSVRVQAAASIDSLHRRLETLRQAYISQPGWTLAIIADNTPLFPSQFDPLNVDIFDTREVLHRRFVRLENDHSWIELFQRPGLTRGLPEHPLFAGITQVTVTGLDSRPHLRNDDDELIVEAEGVEGRFSDAEVSWGDRMLRIRIR